MKISQLLSQISLNQSTGDIAVMTVMGRCPDQRMTTTLQKTLKFLDLPGLRDYMTSERTSLVIVSPMIHRINPKMA